MAAYLGLDVGDKRVGTALAESEVKLASPHLIFDRAGGKAEREIIRLVGERSVNQIVVGLPLNEDGSLNEQCLKVQNFCRRLQKRLSIEIVYVDEYLSTVESEEKLAGKKRPPRGKGRQKLDAVSATIILQRYLDDEKAYRLSKV